jgi:hypothetical protein
MRVYMYVCEFVYVCGLRVCVCVCEYVYVCVRERESTEALVELREKPGII